MSIEINFDGLIGPTHNYAGLSHGNVASEIHQNQPSFPKKGALQGLEKMRSVASLGVPQFFLPPIDKPNFALLRELGFSGTESDMIRDCAAQNPTLLNSVYSAATMWTANAGTVTPSIDSADGKLHFTPANLSRTWHRAFDHTKMHDVMSQIFCDAGRFTIHHALPSPFAISDEGAANHTRLCKSHGHQGLHLFVFGFDPFNRDLAKPKKFPARQSRLASESIVRRHGVQHAMLVQQTPDAIDAGVFHNDVISVGNENVLLMHEHSFLDQPLVVKHVEEFFAQSGGQFFPVEFSDSELPIQDAIDSYFFNSQIVSRPSGNMTLICPQEVEETETAFKCAQRLVEDDCPIDEVQFFDLRQSMNNGGGPACLRLRVVVTEEELSLLDSTYRLDDGKAERLGNWIETHYRDTLTLEALADPALAAESANAQNELKKLLSA
ncbi:N-succinylarginine dihydrolase [Mariniblastus fucicola]|uniref:N-succinylarginine dihydrolase n=1 Tax=Mariniblastus fucicola TaxID=980251 RepID=A0A5B9PB15_9BACT|nr:N-succinylarginine dihydrolase [Mariniblastus fucicola]QEG23484.1 N-succinylarginine dihydrolase [Mariniblastus fucicola]